MALRLFPSLFLIVIIGSDWMVGSSSSALVEADSTVVSVSALNALVFSFNPVRSLPCSPPASLSLIPSPGLASSKQVKIAKQ